MSKQRVIGDMSAWAGMMRNFWRQVGDGSITTQMFATFLQHKNPFAITDIRQEWQEFYRKYFRLNVDFSDLVIPNDPSGFERVIFIPKGLTFAAIIKALRKRFKVYLHTEELDKDVVENVRTTANKNYAIRLRERVEADEELKNFSANQLKEEGVNTLTLLERLVYELKYYSETKKHLDVANLTLCAGSRGSGGGVPVVFWLSAHRKLHVGWCSPGGASDSLRARQAVS